MRVRPAPAGDLSVTARSPTQVWSRPTVVAPAAVVQVVPPNLKLRSVILPVNPLTVSGMLAPVVVLSGIATAGPAQVFVTAAATFPVRTLKVSAVGLPPPV